MAHDDQPPGSAASVSDSGTMWDPDLCYRILHFTDPHFTETCFGSKRPSEVGRKHAREIIATLEKWRGWRLRPRIDVAVLSGDLTFQYRPGGFLAAKAFIETLSPVVAAGGFLVVPGNHDVYLGQAKSIANQPLSLPIPKAQAEKRFRDFLWKVGAHVGSPNAHLAMVCVAAEPGRPELVVAGLNSCRVERHDAQGWGYVGFDQLGDLLDAVLRKRASRRQAGSPEPACFFLVALHHNLLPIWDVGLEQVARVPENRKFSFMMDAAAVLRTLSDVGTDVALHGHAHLQSLHRIEGYGSGKQAFDPLLVMGGGSLGLRSREALPHHFQILDFRGTSDPTVTSTHFTTPCVPKKAHVWTSHSPLHPLIYMRPWRPDLVQDTLANRAPDIASARRDVDVFESWGQLHAYKKGTKAWSTALSRLVLRVIQVARNIPKPVTAAGARSGVIKAVDTFLKTPPPDHDMLQWTLEEYIAHGL